MYVETLSPEDTGAKTQQKHVVVTLQLWMVHVMVVELSAMIPWIPVVQDAIQYPTE